MSAFVIRGHAAAAVRAFGPKLALGALTAVAFAWGAQPAQAYYVFQDVVNMTDPTFNQELGINTAGQIAGYFGIGSTAHPNQGYTVVPPYAQANFAGENFPGSVQTQVTGINNIGTTVGFWVDASANNFGFVNMGGQAGTFTNVNNPNTGTTTPTFNQLLGVNDSNVAVGTYVDGM